MKEEFIRDLNELLKKYDAELTVTDDGRDYGLHIGVCEIIIDAKYDSDMNCIRELEFFNLPSYMDGN